MGNLVLSRKKDEVVVVGGDGTGCPLIRVMVVEIRGDKVRLAFNCDRSIPVHREEVWEEIQLELEKGKEGE